MSEYSLNIMHLYPDLLNLYGDKGNIEALRKRLLWRGIDVGVKNVYKEDEPLFSETDIIFIGGGSYHEERLVLSKLVNYREELLKFVEDGGTLIATCGGFSMLGKYIKTPKETVLGLGIIDIYAETKKDDKRLIGNVILKSELFENPIVGFENHLERIFKGEYSSLGKVVLGFGNNEKAEDEGVIYKNLIGTNLHGPLLPKNPELCDFVLKKALMHKYPSFENLALLDDKVENLANNYVVQAYSR